MREYQVKGNTDEGTLFSAVVFATSPMSALEMMREQLKENLNLNLVCASVDLFKGDVWK